MCSGPVFMISVIMNTGVFKVFHINIKKIRTFSYAEGPKEYSLE